MGFVLLLGGARSGKSDLAVRLASESGSPVTFIATAAPGDREMTDRIERHRSDRPSGWKTVEARLDLQGAINATEGGDYIVIDCLTLWVSNMLEDGRPPEEISLTADRVVDELTHRRAVVVSNEVGLGIVPDNELARRFRDALGSVNSRFAACADRALLLVAGHAISLERP